MFLIDLMLLQLFCAAQPEEEYHHIISLVATERSAEPGWANAVARITGQRFPNNSALQIKILDLRLRETDEAMRGAQLRGSLDTETQKDRTTLQARIIVLQQWLERQR